eukprot:358772-Chlamydomonas_euryale.AAC.20
MQILERMRTRDSDGKADECPGWFVLLKGGGDATGAQDALCMQAYMHAHACFLEARKQGEGSTAGEGKEQCRRRKEK